VAMQVIQRQGSFAQGIHHVSGNK